VILRFDPSALRPERLVPPPSKSDAQRALVLAHVTGRDRAQVVSDEELSHAPADVKALARGLESLSHAADAEALIDCGDGGAPFRFLLGQAATMPGARVRFVGSARLGERPHASLIESLRAALGAHGLRIDEGHPWPVRVRGADGTGSPVFRIDARRSSQYASSLLLAAAALTRREGRTWTVELESGSASEGYLDMTIGWLGRFGLTVRRSGFRMGVRSVHSPASIPAVPGDWSSIAYLLLIAWATGGRVAHVDLQAPHPDRAIVRVLSELGLSLVPEESGLRVEGRARSGLTASGAECPDLLPTLAALACVLPGDSTLDEVGILRHKESDRLEGIRALVRAIGGETTLEGEALRITPPAQPQASFRFDARGDHRMAMSAATLAVLARASLTLEDPECVGKSFPGFWEELAGSGAQLHWSTAQTPVKSPDRRS
jgi:3-phosphoshikimate 1-carboxyvinyltransferase